MNVEPLTVGDRVILFLGFIVTMAVIVEWIVRTWEGSI
jgi:hypothetical protein